MSKDSLRARVLRVVRQVEGDWINQSEISIRLGGHVPAEKLTETLQDLQAEGAVERRTGTTGKKGGRPPIQWRCAITVKPKGQKSPATVLVEDVFRDLLTPAQARKILDVSPTRVHQYAEEGRLAFVNTPLGRLYRREDVERLARWRAERQAKAGRAAG